MENRLPVALIRRLKAHLQKGGLLAYPTESCYGLGCLAHNQKALRRLLYLKKRPLDKGLISIAGDIAQFKPLLQRLPESTVDVLNQQWPAAKTYLLTARIDAPVLLRGRGRKKIAVRIPDHTQARILCRRVGRALVSTSANRHHGKSCKNAREVKRLFGQSLWVIDGKIGQNATPSQIIDFETGAIIR